MLPTPEVLWNKTLLICTSLKPLYLHVFETLCLGAGGSQNVPLVKCQLRLSVRACMWACGFVQTAGA